MLRNYLVINVLQNLLFCVPKAAVLHGKSVGFALQKSRFRNVKAQLSFLTELSLQNQSHFFVKPLYVYCEYADMLLWRDLSRSSYPHCSFRCWERDKLYPYTYKTLFFRVS